MLPLSVHRLFFSILLWVSCNAEAEKMPDAELLSQLPQVQQMKMACDGNNVAFPNDFADARIKNA